MCRRVIFYFLLIPSLFYSTSSFSSKTISYQIKNKMPTTQSMDNLSLSFQVNSDLFQEIDLPAQGANSYGSYTGSLAFQVIFNTESGAETICPVSGIYANKKHRISPKSVGSNTLVIELNGAPTSGTSCSVKIEDPDN